LTRCNKNQRSPVDVVDVLSPQIVYFKFGFVNLSLTFINHAYSLALYHSWFLLIYSVKLSAKVFEKIWRKNGLKGNKIKVKGRKSRQKERRDREKCKEIVIDWPLARKKSRECYAKGYKGFRRGKGASRKRVIRMMIRMKTQVFYRVFLCSWFITVALIFLHSPITMPQICNCIYLIDIFAPSQTETFFKTRPSSFPLRYSQLFSVQSCSGWLSRH